MELFRKISLAVVWPSFAAIVLFTAWMLKQHLDQPDFDNAVLFPKDSRALQPFSLVDHHGRAFDNRRLLGKWSFVFFGYTHCPDVCPLTLQVLAGVSDLLETQADGVQFVFVSVDPARDGNARLESYVGYFAPDFLGVSGEQAQLEVFSEALGATFGRAGDSGEGAYDMSHSAQIFVINPDAERYVVLPHPHRAGVIARDFQAIRAYYRQKA